MWRGKGEEKEERREGETKIPKIRFHGSEKLARVGHCSCNNKINKYFSSLRENPKAEDKQGILNKHAFH